MTSTDAEMVLAHERWFVDPSIGGDWGFFLSPLPLALTAAAITVTVVGRVLARRVGMPEIRALGPVGRLVPWVPRLLGVHLGVSLLALAVTGSFVTPAVHQLEGSAGTVALLAEAALGVWLVTGYRLRPAALLVLLLGPALALAAGRWPCWSAPTWQRSRPSWSRCRRARTRTVPPSRRPTGFGWGCSPCGWASASR